MTPAARRAFIRANTRLAPVPHAPGIRLHLAHEAVPLWQKTEEELGALGLPPPFWAFAWAGGQALARHLLDHPDLVAGRRVLDVASGSGLVAVAAALAGAAAVEANDVDGFALEAVALNVSYERDMAARLTGWLHGLARRGATVLVGDPGRAYLARDLLEEVAAYAEPVTRDQEDAEVKRTGVWRFRASGPRKPGALI